MCLGCKLCWAVFVTSSVAFLLLFNWAWRSKWSLPRKFFALRFAIKLFIQNATKFSCRWSLGFNRAENRYLTAFSPSFAIFFAVINRNRRMPSDSSQMLNSIQTKQVNKVKPNVNRTSVTDGVVVSPSSYNRWVREECGNWGNLSLKLC